MKERLIGAVVLVGIGAWLIPWVLDGPPQPDAHEPASLELPVPDEPLPLRTQTIRLDDRGASPASDTRPSRPTPADTSADARQATVPPAREASSEAPSSQTAPDAAAGSDARAADARAAAETPSAAEPAEEAPVAATAARTDSEPAASERQPAERGEPERASAPQETRAAAATPPAAAGDWLVQLGSFGEEQNAQRLADRVATHGYSPSITNVRAGGRLMHRVRVGPYDTRERAQEAATALSAQGFVAQVVGAD